MTEPLSPAAQAVLDAVGALYEKDIPEDRCIMAATLRTAAGCIVDLTSSTDYTYWDGGHEVGVNRAAILLLAIADELETK